MRKLLFLGVVLFVVAVWAGSSSRPVDALDRTTMVVIVEPGMSVRQIARLLLDRHVIRSSFLFQTLAWWQGNADRLQAGAYELSPSLSLSQVIDVLRQGRVTEARVTIPEGLTIREIDALLASKGFGQPGDLLDCARRCDFSSFDFLPTKSATDDPAVGSRLEGYLFPDTYSVPVLEYHPKFFLERMLGTFRSRILRAYESEIQSSGRRSKDLVIMASLVEEESRHDDERAVIAGILWKRLDAQTPLGVDATTRYEHAKSTAPITREELETLTPYNTRRQRGLPPTPIASFGASSFLAALRPKDSSYWYYLHDAAGVIRYARTDAEHVENKRRYLSQ